MSKPLDFLSIDKGTPIESLSIPALTRVVLARFAGAVDDYNPMYLDDKVAVASGKTSVFAPTNLIMAYIGRMIENWLVGAYLRRFDLKVVRLVWPGDVLTCRGIINDKRREDGECLIEANVWTDNQRGENVAKGIAIAVVPDPEAKSTASFNKTAGIIYNPGGVLIKSKKTIKEKAPTKSKRKALD
ncbi:MAG: MaoC family dehydratase N-terminal domain-containing protein [Deltaproteobacteria bacterium]|nr:MaoC family dehydratase N-terminal domain-containing protein [Deltaproteobacteria bacterium]